MRPRFPTVVQPSHTPEIMYVRAQLRTPAPAHLAANATLIVGPCRLSTQAEQFSPKQARRLRFRPDRCLRRIRPSQKARPNFAGQRSVVAKHFIVPNAAASGSFRAV